MAIAASWIVIEWISKIIISPLLQLTKRVGQISRDAGERLSARFQRVIDGYEEEANVEEDKSELSDDTGRLTRSFNRMLGYLEVPEDGLREYE